MRDAAEKYLRAVYHDRLHEEWKCMAELDPELRRKVQAYLDSLSDHMWSPMASPADHFFAVEGDRMPMSVWQELAYKS